METAILQLGARECLIPSGLLSGDPNCSKLKRSDKHVGLPFLQLVLERSDVLVTEVSKGNIYSIKADFLFSRVLYE